MRARTQASGSTPVDNYFDWDAAAALPVVLQDRRTQSGVTTTTTLLYGLDLIATTDSAAVTSYYLYDGLGSATQLTNSAGAVTDSYTHYVFGAHRTTTGTASNDFPYTGEQNDRSANRGLYYLRARHYDPALGRFLQQDRLPLANLYSYAGNNPVRYGDPTGLCWVPGCNRLVDETRDAIGGVSDWASDKSIQADLIAIAGNFGPPVLAVGIATGNPVLVTAGVVLVGANIGAGLASIAGLEQAERQGCIGPWQVNVRQALVVAGFLPNFAYSMVADLATLGWDTMSPACATPVEPEKG
jgi:RHS repeat-associated protein